MEKTRLDAADSEINKIIGLARASVEEHLGREVEELRHAIQDLDNRFTQDAHNFRTELSLNARRSEVTGATMDAAARCDSVAETLSDRCERFEAESFSIKALSLGVKDEVFDFRVQTRRETAALAGELTQLRAATTSLTNGIIKALQVIGLLQYDTRSGSSTAMPQQLA